MYIPAPIDAYTRYVQYFWLLHTVYSLFTAFNVQLQSQTFPTLPDYQILSSKFYQKYLEDTTYPFDITVASVGSKKQVERLKTDNQDHGN